MRLFAEEIQAPSGLRRRKRHPSCCPTDLQAEVLVHRQVPLSGVLGIVVENEEQASSTYAILRQLRAPVDALPLFICPDFYEPDRLAVALSFGRRPVEEAWHPQADADGEAVGE